MKSIQTMQEPTVDLGRYRFLSDFTNKTSFYSTIYLSLAKTREALDAYKKALALEPNNDTHKHMIKHCEDILAGAGVQPQSNTASAGVN